MVCYIRALVGLNRISSIVGSKTLDFSQESTCSKEIIVFCEYNDTQVPKFAKYILPKIPGLYKKICHFYLENVNVGCLFSQTRQTKVNKKLFTSLQLREFVMYPISFLA